MIHDTRPRARGAPPTASTAHISHGHIPTVRHMTAPAHRHESGTRVRQPCRFGRAHTHDNVSQTTDRDWVRRHRRHCRHCRHQSTTAQTAGWHGGGRLATALPLHYPSELGASRGSRTLDPHGVPPDAVRAPATACATVAAGAAEAVSGSNSRVAAAAMEARLSAQLGSVGAAVGGRRSAVGARRRRSASTYFIFTCTSRGRHTAIFQHNVSPYFRDRIP